MPLTPEPDCASKPAHFCENNQPLVAKPESAWKTFRLRAGRHERIEKAGFQFGIAAQEVWLRHAYGSMGFLELGVPVAVPAVSAIA